MTSTDTRPTSAPDLDKAARRVDTAVERAGLLDAAAQRVAMDLKAAVEEFHREGLTRIVKAMKDDPGARAVLFELVDDPVVYALLAMHGIVRADPVTLAERALAEVRPYLESHGGGVSLVAVELPQVRVRLAGTCNGCSSSSTTLREVVERALVANVPGAHEVVVVPNEPEPALVPLTSVGLRPGAAPAPGAPSEATGWTRALPLDDVRDGRVTLWRPAGRPEDEPGVAIVRIGDAVSAYEDKCAHAGLSLERGMVDSEGCVLTCPWHGLKYQALTGEAISMVDARLKAYTTRLHDAAVWVRLT